MRGRMYEWKDEHYQWIGGWKEGYDGWINRML